MDLPFDFAKMDDDPLNIDFDAFFSIDPHQIDQASKPTFVQGYYPLFEEDAPSSSNHSQLLTVRKEGDEQHKNGRNFQDNIHMSRSLRNEQSFSIIDIDSCDVSTLPGSPPGLSMSTMSSSDSSRSRTTSSNSAASSTFSSPMTPGVVEENSRGVTIGTPLSLPTISQQKLEVLGNAIAWNQHPTADESRFLAAALSLDMYGSSLAQLQKALQMDERFNKKWLPSKALRLGRPRPVALWKRKIIRRALEREPAPSKVAVEFLAAGLRISVQQFWDAPMNNLKQTEGLRTKTRDSILIDPTPKKKSPSHSKDPVQPDISVDLNPTNQATSVVCIIPPPSDSPTYNMSSFDSPPWDPLMNSNPKSIDTVDASITVKKSQYPPTIVENLESLSKCEKTEKPPSEDVEMQDPPGIHDTPMNLVADESQDQDKETESGLVNEVAAILGPEYGHLAEFLISHFVSEPLGDLFQFEYGTRQRPDGVGNTPSSTSSQTPGNASSPNTTASGSSGGKRKFAGGGDGGDPDDVEGDGNGGMPPPPPKKMKKSPSSPQPRYDCPIYRRALRMGGKIHVCAPNGLEFRNLWDHLRQKHYGCETCGLKLSEPRADKKHLREQKNDPSKCQANPGLVLLLEIGMELMEQLEEVYFTPPNVLTPDEKWVRFWKLLFPQDAEADIPDPRHQDTITFTTGNIPTLQETMHKMWSQNPRLRPLDDEEKQEASVLLDRLLRTLPVVLRSRYQNTQPRTPRGPAAAATGQAVVHTAGQSPLYNAGQDPTFYPSFDDMMVNDDNAYNNAYNNANWDGYMH